MNLYPQYHDNTDQLPRIVAFLLRRPKPLSLSKEVKTIEKLMQALQKTDTNKPLLTIRDSNQPDYIKATPSILANAVILALSHCRHVIDEVHYVLPFHPFVDVFMRNARKPGIQESIQRYQALGRPKIYPRYGDHAVFIDLEQAVAEFIAESKRDMSTTAFRKLIYDADRTAKQNAERLCKYIDSLFTRYARLLVIRVDFYYHQGNVIHSEQDRLDKYAEITADRERLFENIKSNNIFKHMVGKVWSLEYGPEKGFHLHMLFFFDGSKVRDDESLAYLIAEYWSGHTHGRGYPNSCNASKDDYDSLGIGMINYYDHELRQNLYKAAGYLVKVDHLVRALVPEGKHTFGKGAGLESDAPKLGRPRRNDLAAL